MKKNLGSLLMVSKKCQSPKMYDEIKEILDDNSCGIRISNEDISTSTEKIIINGVEITDVKSWEKVISTLEEKDKEIERLNNIINELEEDLERNYIRWKKYAKTHKEDAWRMIICKYYLDKLKKLKDK